MRRTEGSGALAAGSKISYSARISLNCNHFVAEVTDSTRDHNRLAICRARIPVSFLLGAGVLRMSDREKGEKENTLSEILRLVWEQTEAMKGPHSVKAIEERAKRIDDLVRRMVN